MRGAGVPLSRRAFLGLLAGTCVAGLSGCQALALIDRLGRGDQTSGTDEVEAVAEGGGEALSAVCAIMVGELGVTDGSAYEDALVAAGGELCGGERGLWCVTFLWWAFHEAGFGELFCGGEPIGWPERQHAWWREHGQLIEVLDEKNPPRPGDIYYQLLEPENRFEGCGDVSHGEFVVGYDPETTRVTCISANPVVEYHEHVLADDVASDMFRGYARPAWDTVGEK